MSFDWPTVLPLIFMAVMGLALLAYVVLDGYDLGVGLLLPFAWCLAILVVAAVLTVRDRRPDPRRATWTCTKCDSRLYISHPNDPGAVLVLYERLNEKHVCGEVFF